MQRRSRTASAEFRIRSITRPATDVPSPPEAPVPIPPPPYAGEPPPPEPPPEPPPPPQVRYEDDGALALPYVEPPEPPDEALPPAPEPRMPSPPGAPPGAPPPGASPGAPPPGASPPGASFAEYGEGEPSVLGRLRNLVAGDELDPGRPGLRVLLVVGVVAVLVGTWYWWRARPHAEPLPAPSPAGSVLGRPHPLPATPTASPSATAVVVDVAGKVRHPGVVHLPTGSRVVDAIDAAGGAKPGAPTGSLNLARVLVDGEQIVVGASGAPTPAPVPGVPPGAATPGATPGGATVSLNTATEEQLDTLPGVGPVLAKRILDYRTQHGGFHSIDELQDVTGIGPKRFADLKPEVTL